MLADLHGGRLNGSKDDEYRRTLRTLIFFEGYYANPVGNTWDTDFLGGSPTLLDTKAV
jgi:hypothetical protein